jgi:hypothetical protein
MIGSSHCDFSIIIFPAFISLTMITSKNDSSDYWILPLWYFYHDFSSRHISNKDPYSLYHDSSNKIPWTIQSFVSHRGLCNHDFYRHDISKQWYPGSRFLQWESLFSKVHYAKIVTQRDIDAVVWIQLLYANNRNTHRSFRPLSGRGLNWIDCG